MNGPLDFEETKHLVRDYVCGECGARLSNPWGGYYGIDGYVVRCVKDQEHQGVVSPGNPTRKLYDIKKGWKEYDIMTQQPVEDTQALALPGDETGMVARMNEAVKIGLFPTDKKVGPAELANLAKLALLYRLDPLMREIMPYQGLPYITLEGRRRIDRRAGNTPSIKIGPMDKTSYEAYVAMGAIDQGDIVVVGQFHDPQTGATIETTGRVLTSETKGNQFLPTVKWRMEMAIKRCEARGRKMLYGPVALPGGLDSLVMYEDGDVIEGAVVRDVLAPERELAEPIPPPQPKVEPDPLVDFPPDDEPPPQPDDVPGDGLTYQEVLNRAGIEGLDQDAFELNVLGCTLATFERRQGASPAVAGRKLTQFLERAGAVAR